MHDDSKNTLQSIDTKKRVKAGLVSVNKILTQLLTSIGFDRRLKERTFMDLCRSGSCSFCPMFSSPLY